MDPRLRNLYLVAVDDFVLADVGMPLAEVSKQHSDRLGFDVRRREGTSGSVLFGASAQPATWNVHFRCPTEDARDALLATLVDPTKGDRRLLAYRDASRTELVVTWAVLREIKDPTHLDFLVNFEASDSAWLSELPVTTRKTITSARDQVMHLAVPGNARVAPTITINPLAARSAPSATVGWSKRRRYIITNNADQPLYRYLLRVDLGDTTALVSGGKALASGNDVRLWIDGLERERTLVGWNSADAKMWFIVPALLPGDAMTIDIVYGNPAAGAPPVLTYPDLPPITLALSSNASHVYPYGAGIGLWWLSSSSEGAIADFATPGAWQPMATLENPDSTDRTLQVRASDRGGGAYGANLDAWRAGSNSEVVDATNPFDGVGLYNPLGIVSLTAGFDWTNTGGWSSLVVLARDSAAEGWNRVFTYPGATDLIGSATYAPVSPTKWLAVAVWPDNFVQLPPRDDTAGTGPTPSHFARARFSGAITVAIDASKIAIDLGTVTVEEWTPSVLGGTLNALFAADAIAGVINNGQPAQWDDQSGNSLHATQDASGRRATYRLNQLAGKPVMDFDGDNDWYITALSGSIRDETILAVIRPDTSVNGVVVGAQSGGRSLQRNSDGTFSVLKSGGATLATSTGAIATGAAGIVVVTITPTDITFAINGTVEPPILNSTTLSGGKVSRLGATGGGDRPFNGLLPEIGSARALSTANRQNWEGYAAHKWGLTGVLPGGHPYKTVVPGAVASVSEADIYEIASEVRLGGGDPRVAPYTALLVGNARAASGAGTPRVACLLSEAIRIDGEERRHEVWLADLTQKREAVSAHAVRGVVGWQDGAETAESPTPEWIPLSPNRPILPNGDFAADIGGWEEDAGSAFMTVERSHDPDVGGEVLGSLRMEILTNSGGIGERVRTIGPKWFQVAGREAVSVAAWMQTDNPDLVPRLYLVFQDEDLAFLQTDVQTLWTPVAGEGVRRVLAARVPGRAVTYRLGVEAYSASAGEIGSVWFDDITVNDNDLVVVDQAIGEVSFVAQLRGRWL